MPLSAGLVKSLGGPTLKSFTEEEDKDAKAKTQDRIDNARTRLDYLGYEAPEPQDSFLVSVLKNLSRTGYAANNMIREFTDKEAGATPNDFDPFKAYARGLKMEEQVEGKDIMEGLGLNGSRGIFGGEAKWYNPSPAGATGLALDVLNPLDALNWLSFGLGKTAIKGGDITADTLRKVFGSKTDEILGSVGDLKQLKASNVGDLVTELGKQTDSDSLANFMKTVRDGMVETGTKASSKLDGMARKRRITMALQNPLTLGRGSEFLKTEVPGTGAIGGALTSLGEAFKKTRVGNELSKRFSTKHVPSNVPDVVILRNLTGYQLDELIDAPIVNVAELPLNREELISLKNTLSNFKLEGDVTLDSIAKTTGFDPNDLRSLFDNEVPFTFDVTELYKAVSKVHPEYDPREAFIMSAKLRSVMDNIYRNIPEDIAPNFKGTIRLPEPIKNVADDGTSFLDDMDQMTSSSPMLSYVFDVKGVEIISTVASNSFPELRAVIKALQQLPEKSLNAIKEQIRLMPGSLGTFKGGEIKGYVHPQMGDIIIRPSTVAEANETIAHEFGHKTMTSYGADPEEYKTIMKGNYVSDYPKQVLDELGEEQSVLEDFAESVRLYVQDGENFKVSNPEHYNFVDRLLKSNRMTGDELIKRLDEQTKRSTKMETLGNTQLQLENVINQIDDYVTNKIATKSGNEAFTELKQGIHELYENISFGKTEDFVKQVEALFKDVPVEERKAIMEIAAGGYEELPEMYAPTFYNKSEKIIEAKMGGRAKSAELKKMLLANGVKDDEMKWLGLDDLLEENDILTKEQVLEHIRMNNLEIEEVDLTQYPKLGMSKPKELESIPDNAYNLMVSLIRIGNLSESDAVDSMVFSHGIAQGTAKRYYKTLTEYMGLHPEFIDDVYDAPRLSGGEPKYSQYVSDRDTGQEYHELLLTLPKMGYGHSNSHWDDDNVVAHVRFDTRKGENGEKVLFVQEFQSDWHQAGRRQGYYGDYKKDPEYIRLQDEASQLDLKYKQLNEAYAEAINGNKREDARRILQELKETNTAIEGNIDRQLTIENNARSGKVADAPFSKTWPNLLMKRMLRYAAENGYDRLAWATGTQNAKLHSLARSFDRVKYDPGKKVLTAIGVGGNTRQIPNVTPDNLGEYVGEGLADRLLATPKVMNEYSVRKPDREIDNLLSGIDGKYTKNWAVQDEFTGEIVEVFETEKEALDYLNQRTGYHELAGVDLEMGGEGMKGFYDNMLPKTFDSYLKKFGVKTEVMGLPVDRSTEKYLTTTLEAVNRDSWLPPTYDIYDDEDYVQVVADRFDDAISVVAEDTKPVLSELDMDKVVNAAMKKVDINFKHNKIDLDESTRGRIRNYLYNKIITRFEVTDTYSSELFDLAKYEFNTSKWLKNHYGKDLFFEEDSYLDDAADYMVEYLGGFDGDTVEPTSMVLFNSEVSQLAESAANSATVVISKQGIEVDFDQLKATLEDAVRKSFKVMPDQELQYVNKNMSVKVTDEIKDMVLNEGQPLFKKGKKTEPVKKAPKLSEKGQAALDSFYKWRQSVIKAYRQEQIPINELENYVPFIPMRGLKDSEKSLLNTMFGTGDYTNPVDPTIDLLSKADPNLLERTTKVTNPREVNQLLDKEWLTEDAAIAMAIRGTRAIKAIEMSKFLNNFIGKYGLSYQDLIKYSGGNVPKGYKMFIIAEENGKKILKEVYDAAKLASKDKKAFFIPSEMAEVYNQYTDLIMGEEKTNALLKAFDKATAAYKKVAYLWNPGHIPRDFTGNVFNNYLMGVVNPLEYVKAAKLLMNQDQLVTVEGAQITVKELLEKAQKVGLLDVGAAKAESMVDIMGRLKYTGKNPIVKAGHKYSELMREGTRKSDMFTRFTGLVHNLDKGMTFNQSSAEVKKFLFDYFDLTPFERKVMKRVIPFYTWMRKNIPLQLEQVMKNPRNYSRIESVMTAVEGDTIDWEDRPDYINDTGAVQLGQDGPYISPNLPFNDLSRVPTNLDAFLQLLSGVNPFIKGPVEIATNQQWFNGRPLEEYDNETREMPFAGLLKMLGADEVPRVKNRPTGYLFDQVPILRNLDVMTNPENPRQTSRISSFIGGPSIYSKESVENAEMYETERILEEFLRKLKDEGIEVPTIRDIRKNPSKLNRIKELLGN